MAAILSRGRLDNAMFILLINNFSSQIDICQKFIKKLFIKFVK